MEDIILALAVVTSVLLISVVSSPKLKAIIYCFPIPITVILLGTGGGINITHLAGLVFVILFLISIYILYKKLKLPIIIAIIASTILYICLGLLNKFIINVPFLFGYVALVAAWLFFIIKPVRHEKSQYVSVSSKLEFKEIITRGVIIFGLAYVIIGLKGLILGAAVTFPFNGVFVAHSVRNKLPVFISEIQRNMIGLINFFLTVWALEELVTLLWAIAAGWVVCGLSMLIVSRYIPHKYSKMTV